LRRALPATVEKSLSALQAVDKGGRGNADAQRAIRELTTAQSADLLKILNALDRASPLAENWIRNAFETVADRELRQKHALPAAELEKFVTEKSHHPRARRLAYEWLVKVDPSATNRLIPGMLLDPASELRRDAVAMRITEAEKVDSTKEKEKAIRLYREALSGATQDDQVKSIVQGLSKLGQKVDIAQHFAFITHFSIIGPFDHHRGVGFKAVYPPEKEIRLDAQYDGQLGKVSWQPIETSQEYGTVDIAKQIKSYKGAVMYAMAEFQSPHEAPLELRLGTQNAWKIWLNGEFVFARDEYHRGSALDQYRLPVVMRAGKNIILLKICQNEQNESWAQSYQFQLRVCDSSGRGVRSQAISVSGGRN
jgi:hypothetical protein